MTENPAKDNDRKALRMQKKTRPTAKSRRHPSASNTSTPVEGAIVPVPGILVTIPTNPRRPSGEAMPEDAFSGREAPPLRCHGKSSRKALSFTGFDR
jgi:hypothetical protein